MPAQRVAGKTFDINGVPQIEHRIGIEPGLIFRAHRLALDVEQLVCDFQPFETLGLSVQHRSQVPRRNRGGIDSGFEARARVDGRTEPVDLVIEARLPRCQRAKHHVLEQVRDSGDARRLIETAGLDHVIHRGERRIGLLDHDQRQLVGQHVLVKLGAAAQLDLLLGEGCRLRKRGQRKQCDA
jgi:hypothetical protein